MGREDEFDRETVERLLHIGRREAERLELGDARGQRFADRLRRPLPLSLPEHADPLPILGDVDQIEIDAEGAGDALRLGGVERFDLCRERPFGVVPAGATVAGKAANLLHQSERLLAGQLHDHGPEHVAEQADVATQQIVVGHGKALSERRAAGVEAVSA